VDDLTIGKNEKSKTRIQSIERAFSILEETAAHRDGITLSDLSRNLDLHTSTLYHLVNTLMALGYLRQVDNTKRYRVGRAVYSLASSCYDEVELHDIALPYLEELAVATGESTHFAIWEREEVLILARASGSNAFQINERAGSLRPTYCTAIGKVLLAGLSNDEFDRLADKINFKRLTPNTLKDVSELRLQIEKVRTEGVAFDDCEYNAETRCMAAPVSDFRGRIVGAIGFSGPIWRLSFSDMAEYIPLTRTIARKFSQKLGGTGPRNDEAQ